MSLVFSAISPHPPILIPGIGKENMEQITKTKEALASLERDLYAAKPDILIIISPHGPINSDHFTINLSDNFEANFEEFGDFSTKIKISGDILLMTNDRERIASKSPVNIISEAKLDHGVGVPFYALGQNMPNIKIIPIYFSLLDNQAHFEFGKNLKEIILNSDKRIAVIASGDLSHCLTENAPVKFNPAGKEFDEKLIDLLRKSESQSIVNMDVKLIERGAQCGLGSILILLGILNNISFETKILSYEAPFGVGYLVADLELK
ncbi:MAG: AmmeMemoRadiSam system protein B [Candidatus Buchananbacteria bacterium]|nr:AmmeMemoRadiSam system protein B [Candidatus Buchananbacteria bacterium]